jgi:hypothetical protein
MMKYNLMTLAAFIVLILFTHSMLSQTKDEREVRIEMNDFPVNGQTILKNLPKSIKGLKLYKETDGEKVSYEAKFKYKKRRYSLEFDTNGSIEDIELIVKEKSLPNEKIGLYFQSNYRKYKRIKIQRQYVNSNSKDEKAFLNDVLNESCECTVNFEIIAEVKTDSERHVKEFLFSETGAYINSRILKPTSYEHIMY